MEQFWRTKRFKSLYQEWNVKLKASGFEDAEIDLKDDRALKQRSTNAYKQASQIERDAHLEYYIFLGHLAHDTIFPNEVEKYVMLRYSEGAEIKEIVKETQKMGGPKYRDTITYIVRRWETNWGIKNWSLKQRHLKR